MTREQKWEVIKIVPQQTPEYRNKWAVYPPGAGDFGDWTDLCDTWDEAQTQADARAHGRV